MVTIGSDEKVTEAQVLGTRNCNRQCEYCRLTKEVPFSSEDELGIEEWTEAFKNMEKFGIKTVKGLGGEWTVKEYLVDLIKSITEDTNIKFALLSNSSFDDKLKKQMVNAGLNGYFASVDYIDTKTKDYERSEQGLKMLLELKNLGVENLGANTVLMPQNMETIPKMLEFLTENEIVMNLCPVHGGDNYSYEYRTKSTAYNINKKDLPILEKLINTLFDMKDDDYLLAVPSSYLGAIKDHAMNLDWKCTEFSQLRIDANGDIKVCPDGGFLHYIEDGRETTKKYNILQLTSNDYKKLYDSWELNEWRKNCPGCGPWSAQYRAEKNKKYSLGDPILQGWKNR